MEIARSATLGSIYMLRALCYLSHVRRYRLHLVAFLSHALRLQMALLALAVLFIEKERFLMATKDETVSLRQYEDREANL